MTQETQEATLRVDLDRLKSEIIELSMIGYNPDDHGIYRMAFTDADMEAKQWLTKRMESAGLRVTMDGAANVIGRYDGTDPNAPAVVIGSHIDTVPCAGRLDGTLGVLTGLEAARRLIESATPLKRPLEIIAFSDEEGRYGGMFGSQAFCGRISPETLHATSDIDREPLEAAMRRHGLDPFKALEASRSPESIASYLELHIEQGPVLDREGVSVGIVEQITGLLKWQITLRGEANHAGTTPMEMRRDAFLGLADFAHEIPRILDENGGPQSRATVGKIELTPGSANTVPGKATFTLDARDTDSGVLRELSEAFRKALSAIARRRDLKFDYEELSFIEPVACDETIRHTLVSSAEALDLNFKQMPSGAAHDAQIMASLAPIGMIFVPSKDGISHSPAEWTDWKDIEGGANLALAAARRLANQP